MTADVAMQIYQDNLDAVSKALMDGDLREVMRYIAIPNMMSTHDTEIVMSSPEELDMVITDFREALLDRGVMPLLSYRQRNAVRVGGLQSMSLPPQPLAMLQSNA